MILNHAKDIRYGGMGVLRVLWEDLLIWKRRSDYMPVMTGVIGYYTGDEGWRANGWSNHVAGGDMIFTGNITETGESIRIPAGAYATFLLTDADEFPRECTVYSIAKSDGVGSMGQYLWSNYNIHSDGTDRGIELSAGWKSGENLAFRSIADRDLITDASITDYHVCAISVSGDIGRCFVDGQFVGTLEVSHTPTQVIYLNRRLSSYNDASVCSPYASEYKFFAFAETAHTDAEVLRNMGWLLGDEASTIRTWEDLTAYSWGDAKTFTWDELNKEGN